jgi:SAM-dependent methyltransferase
MPKPNRILHEQYSKSHVSQTIFRPLTRSAIPISLASALSWPQTNSHSILLVGPRYESDYFLLRGYGFSANRIKLLDQFSTSPRIEVGDAHDMTFADESFDIVILSWCLAYSADPELMVNEAWRTLKQEGVLIACSDSHREKNVEALEEAGVRNLTSVNTFRLFPSGSAILAQFDSPVGRDGRRSVSCVAVRKVC